MRSSVPERTLALFLSGLVLGACGEDAVRPQGPETDRDVGALSPQTRDVGPDSIVDRAIHRFDPELNISGAFRPGDEIQIQFVSRARLPTSNATLRVDMPELESARTSGFDETFRVPVQTEIPPQTRRSSPMAKGARSSIHQSVTVPEPGYYRVVGYVHQGPEDERVHDGQFVVDAALVEK